MQIKRFEAVDMTEALRMVKRELGSEAVILSAKEIRPRGFFSALKKKSVEITAATDYPADDPKDSDAFRGLLAQQLEDAPPTDRVSLSTPPPSTKGESPHPGSGARPASSVYQRGEFEATWQDGSNRLPDPPGSSSATDDTVKPATRESSTVEGAAAELRPRRREAHNPVAGPFYANLHKRAVIALVGPSGSGKSTSVAKLARHCQVDLKKRTGLISLDRFRIGANAMLESIARILNLPLTIVHDAGQLHEFLDKLADIDIVLIDTPGMGGAEQTKMAEICELLRIAEPDETHLVLNATIRDDILTAQVKAFSPVEASRLLFTHMDEYGVSPTLSNLLKETRLPCSFLADGVDLFDDLSETSNDRLLRYGSGAAPSGGRVALFPSKRDYRPTGSSPSQEDRGPIQFVANRNSELFHHPNCKSVKRINAENISAFNTIEQAIEEGFKPCRACCDISMIKKTVDSAFGDQHVSAI
jgi:flagellar biosynthesis protein FlhF